MPDDLVSLHLGVVDEPGGEGLDPCPTRVISTTCPAGLGAAAVSPRERPG